jgi:hypothetical protein
VADRGRHGFAGESDDAELEDHVESPVAAGEFVSATVVDGAGTAEHRAHRPANGLATTAAELGWLTEQIVIVDADLGVSGRFGSERDGYREIVAKLGMGEVGTVFGLEVSPPHVNGPACRALVHPWDAATQEMYWQKVAKSFQLKPIAPSVRIQGQTLRQT